MKITIDIPKEFEKDFKDSNFVDFFHRVIADVDSFKRKSIALCGNYEIGTLEMLVEAFKNAEVRKICSNGQTCKHPNCPKCGTTHSMSECEYGLRKEQE